MAPLHCPNRATHTPTGTPPHPQIARGETTSGQVLADHLTRGSVVKACSNLRFRRLLDEGRPGSPNEQRLAIPVAADNPGAKAHVSALVTELGFAPLDGGTLADSWRQEYGQPVFNQPARPAEAAALIAAAEHPGVAGLRLDRPGEPQ